MTPQELLQQQRRQQVDFNLSLPSVTSRELQAGQYSVAVQRTPKAEQTTLGRLADALGKVNPIIAKYGDAQIAENERQILDVQQQISSMDPAEKERLLARPEAEVNLSKAFRSDYELNPVATYRAKMLLGAEKNVEFNAVLTERIEEFKTKFLKENGDKPSYNQISNAINEITDDYLTNDPTLSANAIMRTGFLQEASVNINKLKQTLPSAMAEEHKQEVLMPNLASSLARMHGSEDRDLERLKSHWEASSSSLSRSEQIKVIDATLGILNFDSSEDELDDGIAFLENMRDAGVTIGTTRLDSSGTPLGESFYEMKLDDLEEMREAVVEKERKAANVRIREKTIEYEDKYKAASKSGHTENYTKVFEDIKEEERRIENLDVSDYERKGYLKALEQGVNDGFREESDIIDNLEAESGRSNASPQAMLSQTRRLLVGYVEFDLEGETYKGVDVSEALIGKTIQADKTADPRTGDDFATFALGPELQKILSEKNQQFLNDRAEAMELVARLDPGEEITLGDKVYTIKDGENIERKRNTIISEHMTSRMGLIMESAKEDVDDLLASAVKKTEEETKVKDEETARLDKIAAEKGLKEKSKEMLRVGSGTIRTRRGARPRVAKRLQGSGIELQQELGGLGVAIGEFFGAEAETVVNMPKLYDSLEHTLRYNPNTPEETKIILEDVEALYDEAQPVIKGELRKAKDRVLGRGRRAVPNKPVFVQKYEELSNDVFRARRLFKGYTPEEVKKALSGREGEPGYLPEGAIIKDPKSFFRNELLGEFEGATRIPKGGFKASALLKDMTDEQSAEIAKLLDVSPEILKQRQKDYRDYRSGVRKPVPEAKVTPKEAPKEPEIKQEAKPKRELPPIPKGPKFKQEQLELNLDEPIKTDPTVEAKVTGTKGNISIYSPQKGGDKMEGGYPSSRPGPDGKFLVRTVQEYAEGKHDYITLAGNPAFYNKEYVIPALPYKDPKTGEKKTFNNVRAIVHDTGEMFKTAPEFRFDIPLGKDLKREEMEDYELLLNTNGISYIPAVEPRDSEPVDADDNLSDDGALKGTGLLPRIN